MIKIKKIGFLDKYILKKNKSFSIDTDKFLFLPFDFLHQILPLRFKFLPESFMISDNDITQGLVSASKIHGNNSRIAVIQLCFSEANYDIGKQLIEYIIAKYAAKGASSFIVKIDENHTELLDLFCNGCGFRQCSYEKIWEINQTDFQNNTEPFFRLFKNSDAKTVCDIFNDKIITHFKPSLVRQPTEFYDTVFQGLTHKQIFKYVTEDKYTSCVTSFITISTADNYNYSAEVFFPDYIEPDLDAIFKFIYYAISKRTKRFKLFTKSLGYLINNEKFEQYLRAKGFEPINTRQVLTKDFYRVIKEPLSLENLVMLNRLNNPSSFKVQMNNSNN